MRIDGKVWRLATLLLVAALAIFESMALLPSALPYPGGDTGVPPGATEPVIDFDVAEFNFTEAAAIPAMGWRRGDIPDFKLLPIARERGLDPRRFWARIRFDRAQFGPRPIALYVETVRDSYVVYLNGAELYRSRADPSDKSFTWNPPLFVPLPPSMLRNGDNVIVFRVETISPNLLGIGSLRVGPDRAVRAKFDRQFFFSNSAPQVVSGYLLILSIGAISFWIRRPNEQTYGWVAVLGVVWIFRNLHYFVPSVPFGRELFWVATTDSIFVLSAVTFGFAVNYFNLSKSRLLHVLIFSFCAVEIVLRNFLIGTGRSEMPAFLLTIPMTIVVIGALMRACLRTGAARYWSMFAAITLAVCFGLHDMLFSFNISKGAGFFLQPYGGLLIFAAFNIALTSRLQAALIDVEDVNLKLEARVAGVTASLEKSEAARAELQVALAVDGERERIMREIHDGIGSSLLTALATAKNRNESPETIATLSRSLTDLRIGVDSLEPLGGDVVALLANLRHRMERELKGAGVNFIWKVDHAPNLPWLDPVSALHILRILQEAVGNAILHGNAVDIEVVCGARHDHDAPGVLIEISDRGVGFDQGRVSRGKGLANMAARANAISAKFWCRSQTAEGTTISLWLPVVRDTPARF